jgi:hypothetical protein
MVLQETARHAKGEEAFVGMVHVISIAVLAVLTVGSLGGVFSMALALAPTLTQRSAGALQSRGFFSFLTGLGVLALLLLAGGLSHGVPPLALAIAAVSTVASILALASCSEVLGRKLAILSGRDGSRISHLLQGWIALSLASMVPVLGWFIIFPYALVAGLGSLVLGFFSRDEL